MSPLGGNQENPLMGDPHSEAVPMFIQPYADGLYPHTEVAKKTPR